MPTHTPRLAAALLATTFVAAPMAARADDPLPPPEAPKVIDVLAVLTFATAPPADWDDVYHLEPPVLADINGDQLPEVIVRWSVTGKPRRALGSPLLTTMMILNWVDFTTAWGPFKIGALGAGELEHCASTLEAVVRDATRRRRSRGTACVSRRSASRRRISHLRARVPSSGSPRHLVNGVPAGATTRRRRRCPARTTPRPNRVLDKRGATA